MMAEGWGREESGMEMGEEGEKGETNEEKMSPKKAFSFPISGSVFVNSVCAFA